MAQPLHLALACIAVVLAACFSTATAQANTTQYSKYNYTFVPRAATWKAAVESCNLTYGGHLVSIHSAEEQSWLWDTFINDQDVSKFPIQVPTIYPGNDNVGHRGVWIGFRTSTVGGEWEDRSPVDFTSWIEVGTSKKPDNFKGQESCVQIYVDTSPEGWAGGWDDISCESAMPYICKKRVGFKKAYTPLLFRGFEYIWHPQPASYASAQRTCMMEDRGHVVSVGSQDDMAFLLNAFVRGQPPVDFQVGLPKGVYPADYSLKGFWLGYQKDARGNFSWSDANATAFTAWAPTTPDSFNGSLAENCTHVYLDELPDNWNGQWNDISCAARMPFICKRRSTARATTATNGTANTTATPAPISWDPNVTATLPAGGDTLLAGDLAGLGDLPGEGASKKSNRTGVYIGIGGAIGGVLLLVAVVVGCSMMKIRQQPLYKNRIPPSANEV